MSEIIKSLEPIHENVKYYKNKSIQNKKGNFQPKKT